jgi:hypothetical protein
MPTREITVASVHSVWHLRQYDAAKRLGVSVSVLKKACKTFGMGKWTRNYGEDLLGDHGVQHKAQKQIDFAAALFDTEQGGEQVPQQEPEHVREEEQEAVGEEAVGEEAVGEEAVGEEAVGEHLLRYAFVAETSERSEGL